MCSKKTKGMDIFEKHSDCIFLGWGRFYPGSPSGVMRLTRGSGVYPDVRQMLKAQISSSCLRRIYSSHVAGRTVRISLVAGCMVVEMQKEENKIKICEKHKQFLLILTFMPKNKQFFVHEIIIDVIIKKHI